MDGQGYGGMGKIEFSPLSSIGPVGIECKAVVHPMLEWRRREFALEIASADRRGGCECAHPWHRVCFGSGMPTVLAKLVEVNDVHSQLNHTRVREIARPTSLAELQRVIRAAAVEG